MMYLKPKSNTSRDWRQDHILIKECKDLIDQELVDIEDICEISLHVYGLMTEKEITEALSTQGKIS